ncbi:MAG TPA: non-homologous end-joining DNA ligase [Flavisolibacter sp.]|jgi:bifunctional non-homologous end joining protein LigD|nr:non-homologous end-joining DNA ligase [Flavisolibacter sp.]
MSQKKSATQTKSQQVLSVKKLPAKSSKAQKPFSIDVKRDRKDYKSITAFIKRDYSEVADSEMPVNLKPMLATITSDPFNNKDWQFEIKWDGYRALAYLHKGDVQLSSRNNLSFNDKYPPVVKALKEWPVNAVVDGEIVVLSENGNADFNGLQYWKQFQKGEIVFYAFDILWLEGIDLMGEPLIKRREILKKILPDKGLIRYSDDIEEFGVDFFKAAKENKVEGIIAKRKDSIYMPGQRTHSWYKIKAEKRHEAVICGYTRNTGTDRLFSSLVLGMYQGKELVFIGQIGTGWNALIQKDIMRQMKPLKVNASPFPIVPPTNAETVWIRPKLVCEVKYTELTKEGVMRHPSFQGMREDKKASEVQLQNDIIIPKERNIKHNKWYRHQ